MAPRIPYLSHSRTDAELIAQAEAFQVGMASRRTVRSFAPTPVSEAVIRALVATAASAPSGAHRQPWHFVAVGDPVLKSRIREAAEEEERRNYEGRMPPEWLAALEPFETDAHKPYLEVAPWLITIFAQARGEEGKNYYVSESVGIATGFLIAAIHQAGLASVTHTPSPMRFLAEILERPEGERAFLLLAVGHPAEGCTVPDLQRKELEEVLTVR